jgi:Domain of Unknown Function (DUF928)
MSNSFKRRSLGLSLLLGVFLFASAAEARSPMKKFKGPRRGAPAMTSGLASRSAQCIANQQKFQVLMPTAGVTTSERPTFLVYLPESFAKFLELGVETQDGSKEIYAKSFAIPKKAGIVRLDLKDAKLPSLSPNQSYRWFVTLACDEVDRSNDAIASGVMQRVAPNAALSQKLAQTPRNQQHKVYAESGLWLETLASLDASRRARPNDVKLRSEWESLLKSVQLERLAQAPLVE